MIIFEDAFPNPRAVVSKHKHENSFRIYCDSYPIGNFQQIYTQWELTTHESNLLIFRPYIQTAELHRRQRRIPRFSHQETSRNCIWSQGCSPRLCRQRFSRNFTCRALNANLKTMYYHVTRGQTHTAFPRQKGPTHTALSSEKERRTQPHQKGRTHAALTHKMSQSHALSHNRSGRTCPVTNMNVLRKSLKGVHINSMYCSSAPATLNPVLALVL